MKLKKIIPLMLMGLFALNGFSFFELNNEKRASAEGNVETIIIDFQKEYSGLSNAFDRLYSNSFDEENVNALKNCEFINFETSQGLEKIESLDFTNCKFGHFSSGAVGNGLQLGNATYFNAKSSVEINFFNLDAYNVTGVTATLYNAKGSAVCNVDINGGEKIGIDPLSSGTASASFTDNPTSVVVETSPFDNPVTYESQECLYGSLRLYKIEITCEKPNPVSKKIVIDFKNENGSFSDTIDDVYSNSLPSDNNNSLLKCAFINQTNCSNLNCIESIAFNNCKYARKGTFFSIRLGVNSETDNVPSSLEIAFPNSNYLKIKAVTATLYNPSTKLKAKIKINDEPAFLLNTSSTQDISATFETSPETILIQTLKANSTLYVCASIHMIEITYEEKIPSYASDFYSSLCSQVERKLYVEYTNNDDTYTLNHVIAGFRFMTDMELFKEVAQKSGALNSDGTKRSYYSNFKFGFALIDPNKVIETKYIEFDILGNDSGVHFIDEDGTIATYEEADKAVISLEIEFATTVEGLNFNSLVIAPYFEISGAKYIGSKSSSMSVHSIVEAYLDKADSDDSFKAEIEKYLPLLNYIDDFAEGEL